MESNVLGQTQETLPTGLGLPIVLAFVGHLPWVSTLLRMETFADLPQQREASH